MSQRSMYLVVGAFLLIFFMILCWLIGELGTIQEQLTSQAREPYLVQTDLAQVIAVAEQQGFITASQQGKQVLFECAATCVYSEATAAALPVDLLDSLGGDEPIYVRCLAVQPHPCEYRFEYAAAWQPLVVR